MTRRAALDWLIVLAAAALLVAVAGCVSWGGAAKQATKDTGSFFSHLFTGAPGTGGPNYAIIGIVASLLFVVGVVALVASFWIPLIPRRASVVCLLVSIGCWALQWTLDAYLGIAVLAVVIAGVVAAVPWVIGYVRLSIQRAGERLALTHPREGVAVQAVANPKKMKRRKELLYEALSGSQSAPPAGSGALNP